MTRVEQYWNGVLKRLQAEVDGFNRLISHMGEMGRENELSLARVLERLVPMRYGVGSGLLIDSYDGESSQTDIVIFDQADQPTLLAQTNQVLFPVENVSGCIEVKTTADGNAIRDVGAKRRSVADLRSHFEKDPLFVFVAYASSLTAVTLANHIRALNHQDSDDRPDLLCVLELGLFGMRTELATRADLMDVEDTDQSDYVLGLTLMQEEQDGERQLGNYRAVPRSSEAEISIGGFSYPIVSVNGDDRIAEPPRALLLFCEALLTLLADRDSRPFPAMHHYVTPVARDLLHI